MHHCDMIAKRLATILENSQNPKILRRVYEATGIDTMEDLQRFISMRITQFVGDSLPISLNNTHQISAQNGVDDIFSDDSSDHELFSSEESGSEDIEKSGSDANHLEEDDKLDIFSSQSTSVSHNAQQDLDPSDIFSQSSSAQSSQNNGCVYFSSQSIPSTRSPSPHRNEDVPSDPFSQSSE